MDWQERAERTGGERMGRREERREKGKEGKGDETSRKAESSKENMSRAGEKREETWIIDLKKMAREEERKAE